MITKQLPTTDFDASYGRLDTMALRVAALAASVMKANRIEYTHWTLGQEQAELWRSSLHQLYAQVNSDEMSPTEPTLDERIIACVSKLEKRESPSGEKQLLPSARDVAKWLHLDTAKVEPILLALARNGVLESESGRQSVRYKLASEGEECGGEK
jgi:hypothetical protein